MDGDDLVRLLIHRGIQPDVVVVLLRIRDLERQGSALESDTHVDTGPVEGQVSSFDFGSADAGDPAVGAIYGFSSGFQSHEGNQHDCRCQYSLHFRSF